MIANTKPFLICFLADALSLERVMPALAGIAPKNRFVPLRFMSMKNLTILPRNIKIKKKKKNQNSDWSYLHLVLENSPMITFPIIPKTTTAENVAKMVIPVMKRSAVAFVTSPVSLNPEITASVVRTVAANIPMAIAATFITSKLFSA